jgi:hypothetical protein
VIVPQGVHLLVQRGFTERELIRTIRTLPLRTQSHHPCLNVQSHRKICLVQQVAALLVRQR